MASLSIPWQVFPLAFLILAIGVLVWNSKKMRLRLGDKPTREIFIGLTPVPRR